MPPSTSTNHSADSPQVVMCLEHVARELSVTSAIAELLWRRHGIRAQIRSLLEPAADWPRHWNPSVLTIPFARMLGDFGVRDLMSHFPDASYVNFAFEQHLSRANERFKCPKDDWAKRRVTHLVSSPTFATGLRRVGVLPENIHVIGNLVCQLTQSPYRERFSGQRTEFAQRHGLDADLPWILFPENFAAAFFRRCDRRRRIKEGFGAADLNDYVKTVSEACDISIRWLLDEAKRGRCEVILRPRPSTNQGYLEKLVRKRGGVGLPRHLRIIKDGDIRPWLFAADAVVSNFSSSLVEAAAAGRPVALVRPTPWPASMETLWTQHAPVLTDEDAMRQFIDVVIDSDASTSSERHVQRAAGFAGPLDQTPLRRWIDQEMLHEEDAILRVTERLAKLVSETQSRQPQRSKTPVLPIRKPMWQRIGVSAESYIRGLKKGRTKAFGHEQDSLPQQSVADERQRWAQIFDQHGGPHAMQMNLPAQSIGDDAELCQPGAA